MRRGAPLLLAAALLTAAPAPAQSIPCETWEDCPCMEDLVKCMHGTCVVFDSEYPWASVMMEQWFWVFGEGRGLVIEGYDPPPNCTPEMRIRVPLQEEESK